MTPLLCVLWCVARRSSASRTVTERPCCSVRARAVARPTRPPPTTATSAFMEARGSRSCDHALPFSAAQPDQALRPELVELRQESRLGRGIAVRREDLRERFLALEPHQKLAQRA